MFSSTSTLYFSVVTISYRKLENLAVVRTTKCRSFSRKRDIFTMDQNLIDQISSALMTIVDVIQGYIPLKKVRESKLSGCYALFHKLIPDLRYM